MDFFTKADWFDRPGPYAFRIEHILFIVFSVLIGVGLSLILKKREKKTIKIVLITLWAFALAVLTFYYGFIFYRCISDPVNHPFNLEGDLPLHSCTFFFYIFPFAMFSKNKYIKTAAFSFMVGISMTMGLVTMFVGCPASLFSFSGLCSLLYHAVIFIIPLIMVVTNFYDLQKDDLRYGLMLFGLLALTMWTFDALTGCDYFYIYDGHTFGILYVISENVPHIIWTMITVTCYVLTAVIIHYSIYGIKTLIKNRKAQKPQPENE